MSLTIHGSELSEHDVRSTIDTLLYVYTAPKKADLVEVLTSNAEIKASQRAYWAKRMLRYATERDWIRYDPDARVYLRTDLPASPQERHEQSPCHQSTPAKPTARKPQDSQTDSQFVGLSFVARGVCLLISGGAILAVVSINGLFAASIAGTPVLAAILITALVSIDLMRPFLVAMALISFKNRLWLRFLGALGLALVLAPLSVFTSFSMLSAEFAKGADTRLEALQTAGNADATRTTLDEEIGRLRDVSEAQWAEWRRECGNGGCGPNAGRLQEAAARTDAQIAHLVEDRQRLPETPQGAHDRASRITTSLTLFDIPERRVVQLAPLLLALGLELAAVLGPAILLVPIRPARPARAPRFASSTNIEGEPS